MHYLDESHISLFLIQVFILLVSAKVLGALCQRRGVPALAGEILAGIVLGPTIFGRILPSFQKTIFPPEVVQVGVEVGQRGRVAAGVPLLAVHRAGMAADAGVEVDHQAQGAVGGGGEIGHLRRMTPV